MDDIVKQALAKWPNVPHCYGWLALDARGNWRMRDERAQALKLSGDKICHPTLLGFINRNYQADERGCWYFQNGPQRVYVSLDATPYIARWTPDAGFVLHTGVALGDVERAYLTDEGNLILKSGQVLAQVDDRDLGACLASIQADDEPASDEQVLAWLNRATGHPALALALNSPYHRTLSLERAKLEQLASRYTYVRQPQPIA